MIKSKIVKNECCSKSRHLESNFSYITLIRYDVITMIMILIVMILIIRIRITITIIIIIIIITTSTLTQHSRHHKSIAAVTLFEKSFQ